MRRAPTHTNHRLSHPFISKNTTCASHAQVQAQALHDAEMVAVELRAAVKAIPNVSSTVRVTLRRKM